MWRAEPLWLLVIGADDVQCADSRSPGTALRHSIVAIGTERADRAMRRTAVKALESLGTGPARVRVLVSDRWLALATIPWSEALVSGDLRARDSFVRDQLQVAGLDVLLDDVLHIDDRSPYGKPRIAVAYPVALIECLTSAGHALGAQLESVQPLAVAAADLALARVGRPMRALALLDGEWLRFMHRHTGGWTAGPLHREPALRSGAAACITVLWRRQTLRQPGLVSLDGLHALALDGNQERVAPAGEPGCAVVEWRKSPGTSPMLRAARAARRGSSLEAIAPASRRNVVPWLATAACMAAATVAAAQAFQISTAAQAQELAARRNQGPPARAAPPSWTRAELARVNAVNAAVRELNLPIGAVLRAVRPPRDIRVALLGIDVEPGRQAASIKLNAESPSGAEMARYVGYLAERPPLAHAYLLSHRIDEGDPARPYRFTVEMTWRD